MASLVVGVWLAPALDRGERITGKTGGGGSTLWGLGHAVSAAAHEDLLHPKTSRARNWCPLQEKGAVLAPEWP
jgi:hypothetical protein